MIGARKGEGCAGLILGIPFGPFAILFALFSKGNRKTCPYCKEWVHKDASVCPRCQREILGQSDEEKEEAERALRRGQLAAVVKWRMMENLGEVLGICVRWVSVNKNRIGVVVLLLLAIAIAAYLLPVLYDVLR